MKPLWRPLGVGDIPDCAAVSQAIADFDGGSSQYTAAQLAERITAEHIELDRAGIGCFAGDSPIGFGLVGALMPFGTGHQVRLRGGVHPARRGEGIGRKLVGWLVERAAALHGDQARPDTQLVVYGEATNQSQRRLLQRFGFRPAREFISMECELAGLDGAVTVPDGLRLLDYTSDVDEATRSAFNDSFADHWDAPSASEWQWRSRYTGSTSFLPGMSAVLLDEQTSQVAAFVLSYLGHAAQVDGGDASVPVEIDIGDVGTVRSWRSRGAASALLAHVLRRARDAGYPRATLAVDAQNPTGALGVYERCGFTAEGRWAAFTRDLG
ncbi:MAG: GNAT family N-acetyltransferase [Sciscionella sp.]